MPQHIQTRIVHTWHAAQESLLAAWRAGLARLPSACALCAAWPDGPICKHCESTECTQALRCPRCALALTDQGLPPQRFCADCRQTPLAWDACHAAVRYSQAWAGLMHRFKNGDVGLSRLFAGQMLKSAEVVRAIGDADLLIPVPSHAQRLLERGYNPAQLLSQQLSRRKTHAQLLRRSHIGLPQRGLSRQARLGNSSLMFTLAPGARLEGASVLLVDDVMTTGATLEAAAQALQHGGAKHIGVLVFARTEKTHDHP